MPLLVLMLLQPIETGPMPREVPDPAEVRGGKQDVNPVETRKPPPPGYDPVETTNERRSGSDRIGLIVGVAVGGLAAIAVIAWRNRRKPDTP